MTTGLELFDKEYLAKRGCNAEVLKQVAGLAVELAREGREGRRIGTIFSVGDSDRVLAQSRPLILDPLYGHPAECRRIEDSHVRETLKELAQLDGAFVISDEGVALSACRYLNASVDSVQLPMGLGSRHFAAASISRATRAVAVVVSQSAVVRIFDDGELVSEVIPELWMLRRFQTMISGPVNRQDDSDVAVVSKRE